MKKLEYSEETQAEIRSLARRWTAGCRKTTAFKALPKSVRSDFNAITSAFAELMYNHHLQTPEHWTAAALEDVLAVIFPRKILISETFFSSVEPSLLVFFAYLRDTGILKNHTPLVSRLKTSAVKMRRLVEEPPRHSAGKLGKNESCGEDISQSIAEWRWDESAATSDANLSTKPPEPSLAQWARLYGAAVNLKSLTPWSYLKSSDLITIMLPEREEPVFCSIMGYNGECYAIGVYPGYEALIGYHRLASAPPDEPPFIYASEQNCLMCYLGDRKEVSLKERKILKELDLHFRGRNEWIYFRAMRPGYYPWYLNAEQADLLTQVLQNLIMASTHLIEQKLKVDFNDGETLLRFYSPEKALWLNAAIKMPPLPLIKPMLIIENEILTNRLKKQAENGTHLEFEVTYLPTPIQENKEDDPYLPKLILLVDRILDLILDQYMPKQDETIEDAVLEMLIGYIGNHGRPATIYVRDDRTSRYLKDLCTKINVKLVEGEGVPIVDKILVGMLDSLK